MWIAKLLKVAHHYEAPNKVGCLSANEHTMDENNDETVEEEGDDE